MCYLCRIETFNRKTVHYDYIEVLRGCRTLNLLDFCFVSRTTKHTPLGFPLYVNINVEMSYRNKFETGLLKKSRPQKQRRTHTDFRVSRTYNMPS